MSISAEIYARVMEGCAGVRGTAGRISREDMGACGLAVIDRFNYIGRTAAFDHREVP
ncbi:hypothetical protein [Breoghania sp.]|uniref:hypothetical protein n=1 Tax=Breoghania sp. TaxID=2065378 RepID=UPI002635CFBB|nr:hypothetical protein [Breoghania sp.]MDJ0930192.1 hypothetical protein [Breoghania sp.]